MTARRDIRAPLGSKNVPATIIAVGVLFLLAICLDVSIQVTRLSRRAKNVSQEQALLEHRVAELENCRGESRGAGSDA